MSSIFLSHSSKDRYFAKKLADDLKFYGIKVWLDQAELKIGDSLIEKIQHAIDDMEFLGVILSPNSVKSNWVKKELEVALIQEINRKKIKVLPILRRSCDIPSFLVGKIYADLSSPTKYEQNLNRLIATIANHRTLYKAGRLGKPSNRMLAEIPLQELLNSPIQLPKMKKFAENYLLKLDDLSKRIHWFVLNEINNIGLSPLRYRWLEGYIFLNVEIPQIIIGVQDQEWGGIQMKSSNASKIFIVADQIKLRGEKLDPTETNWLYLSPTGELLFTLLDAWQKENCPWIVDWKKY